MVAGGASDSSSAVCGFQDSKEGQEVTSNANVSDLSKSSIRFLCLLNSNNATLDINSWLVHTMGMYVVSICFFLIHECVTVMT